MKKSRKTDQHGWIPIRPRECDLCERIARWKHPAGGYRCDKCERPAEKPKKSPLPPVRSHVEVVYVHHPSTDDRYAHMDGCCGDIAPQTYDDWIQGMERR